MILKEAFRFQNYLNRLVSECAEVLTEQNFVNTTTQHHLKSKAVAGVEDEDIVIENEVKVPFDPDDAIEFLNFLAVYKEQLTKAISDAKRAHAELDIDGELANNSTRRTVNTLLKKLGSARLRKAKTRSTAYTFNNEGNQTSYYYDVEITTEPKYDVERAATLAKAFANNADEASTAIDKAMVEIEVDFEPMFTVNDSFEDAIKAYLKTTESPN